MNTLYYEKSNLFSTTGFNSSNSQTGGSDTVGIATNFLSSLGIDPLGGVSNILTNGLDFSCWNSSYTPNQAKIDAPLQWNYILEKSGINKDITANTINEFLKLGWGIKHGASYLIATLTAKCSKDGHKYRESFFIENIDNMIKSIISSGYQIQWESNKSTLHFDLTDLPNWGSASYHGEATFAKAIKVTPPQSLQTIEVSVKGDDYILEQDVITINPITTTSTGSTDPKHDDGKGFPWWVLGLLFI